MNEERHPLTKQLGRFEISRDLILSQPDKLKALFSELVVVEAQPRWERDRVEYLAMSHMFLPLEEGAQAPFYDIIFHREEDGSVTVEGVKRAYHQQ